MAASAAKPRRVAAPIRLPYARHAVGRRERAAVARALASAWIAQGPLVAEFEAGLARAIGVRHALAVSSGTSALAVALAALGVGAGDEVIVPPLTFAATANAVLQCGATPVFADVAPDTLNLDPAQVAARRTRRTRGAIAVHYAGHPADVDAIRDALGPRRFVLEDACHALGATLHGRAAGALGDAACFSFHPAKLITTGEGGAVATGDGAIAAAARQLRDHGIERDAAGRVGLGLPPRWRDEERGDWVYEMHRLGANHRLAEPAAALGLAQLGRLGPFLARRRALARAYQRDLAGEPLLELPAERSGAVSAWHLYPVRVREGALRGGRAALFAALRARGIGVQVHYVPVHLHPYYRGRFGLRFGDYPEAERAYLHLVSLPLFPSLLERDRAWVVECVRDALRRLAR
ncbi:MAG: UDP-4-amino-4,6-dideoxy-N-acetyl-beta-L-altrosamine transaminase [Proteobacteria bacterium]|nr:MAG: UDP-4-amino-4,6-dideoxy-N-acetyl-beta-L-altrosamine transaminase [Pseudomonadota bacterium]